LLQALVTSTCSEHRNEFQAEPSAEIVGTAADKLTNSNLHKNPQTCSTRLKERMQKRQQTTDLLPLPAQPGATRAARLQERQEPTEDHQLLHRWPWFAQHHLEHLGNACGVHSWESISSNMQTKKKKTQHPKLLVIRLC
jgi:hypothetical protein